jgi:hypothetical protein
VIIKETLKNSLILFTMWEYNEQQPCMFLETGLC